MTDQETFVETKVVTRNFIVDFLQRIRNYVGWRQRAYEDMIEDASSELLERIESRYHIDWYRIDIDQMGAGAMSVSIYGQGVPK